LRQKNLIKYKKIVVATIKLMTPVTNALSSKEASPNEKGQISSINMWQSYGSSYNKWMKKGLLVGKEMKKRNPAPQQQVDEKERSSSLPFAAAWKRDEKG
jgi:hypothetical protein